MAIDATPLRDVLIGALPARDIELLRKAAAPRFITEGVAARLTDSTLEARELINHPMVQIRSGGDQTVWTMNEAMRRALLDGAEEAEELWQRVATTDDSDAAPLEPLYARLSAASSRSQALEELRHRFDAETSGGNVPAAHDLLQLLDEWPVSEASDAQALRWELRPKLRRYGRTDRDRALTARYFERPFETALADLLIRGDDARSDAADPWLLEIHAPGGRGKTFFLKHLFARYCPQRDIPVARIDFDYVANLALATQEPVRLLLAIAGQLSPQLPGSPLDTIVERNRAHKALLFNEALPRRSPATSSQRGADDVSRAIGDVPRQICHEVNAALHDDPLLIVIDTVENVLHTPDADLMPLLELLDSIRSGRASDGHAAVSGLRVIVSGRFDLTGTREIPGGESRPRCPGFNERWMGSEPWDWDWLPGSSSRWGPSVRIGEAAMSFELPAFAPDEAREYLITTRGIADSDVVDAIVDRCHDNPMKLALLAEYVERHEIAASVIQEFESVELVYLVDRVVDRIADGRVQWLLRWGALMDTLTWDAVDQVIWPALQRFAAEEASKEHSDHRRYDDVRLDQMPASPHDVDRWLLPTVEEVEEPGARERAWESLLDYAADASWVSRIPDVDDAVMFHNEVRTPLRDLLRRQHQPAFDDIHERALRYCLAELSSITGARRRVVLRNAIFHAYQPWHGPDREPPDDLWHRLIAEGSGSRADRSVLALALLEVASHAEDPLDADRPYYLAPSPDVVDRAHLEAAEALIDQSVQEEYFIDQYALNQHREALSADLRQIEPRRTAFVDCVYLEAVDRVDEGWQSLGAALAAEPPDAGEHLELVVDWASGRTSPREHLQVAERLAGLADSIGRYGDAALPLVRGLLATERWSDALEAATVADDGHLMAEALLAMGRADAVLHGLSCSSVDRARAALQQCRPRAALKLLDSDPALDERDEEALVARGEAYRMLEEHGRALEHFGSAAQRPPSKVNFQANMYLGDEIGDQWDADSAGSVYGRFTSSNDPVFRLRANLGEFRVSAKVWNEPSADEFAAAEDAARVIDWLPPSVDVELAVARLVLDGPTPEDLWMLAAALERVDGAGARLMALEGIDLVGTPPEPADREIADRLVALVDVADDAPAPVLLLATAELERVLGRLDRVEQLLRRIAGLDHDEFDVVERRLDHLRSRLGTTSEPGDPRRGDDREPDAATPLFVEVSTPRSGDEIRFDVRIDPSDREQFSGSRSIPLGPAASGAFALLETPYELYEHLGSGFDQEYVEVKRSSTSDPFLHLHLRNEGVAAWPWELATVRGEAVAPVLRRRGDTGPGDELLISSLVHVELIGELEGSKAAREVLGNFYPPSTTRFASSSADRPLEQLDAAAGVVHLAAQPVDISGPGLVLDRSEPLAPERLANLLGGVERLVVLDLLLDEFETMAAEQIMIANKFCWLLQRRQPAVDILCGVFSDDSVAPERLARLGGALATGRPLAEFVADDQIERRRAHPFRAALSFWTDNVALRVSVGA